MDSNEKNNKRATPSVYNFSEASEFLKATFEEIKSERPTYSIRAWAKLMKANNPTTLARVLAGQRKVPKSMIPRIANILNLAAEEKAYFELLALVKTDLTPESFQMVQNAFLAHHAIFTETIKP